MVKKLMTVLDLNKNQVIAFGNGGNDVELLKNVKYGVAVSNAEPAALAAARFVIKSNDHDGVACFIQKY